jgi:amidohydrolase
MNVAAGPFFASPTQFRVEITGRGGPAAAPPHSGAAVVVAAYCVTALQTVVSRSVSPLESAVLTVGTMKAGYRSNVIAESATLTGTIRSYTDAVRNTALRRAEEVIAGVCAAFGATYRLTHKTTCPPLVNDPAVTAIVRREGAAFFGEGQIYSAPSMGAEDMADFLAARPGCFFWLGARNEAKGIAGRHHDSGFVVDEDALPLGVEFGLRVIDANLRDLAEAGQTGK